MESTTHITGSLEVVLTGADGEVKYRHSFKNLITQVGNQMYAERGAGLSGALAAPTGMALGTGTTAVATSGAGAAMVTGISGSAVAVGTPTSATGSGTSRQITYTCTWPAGTATQSSPSIAEVVLQNGTATTVPTNASTTNVVARALLSPTVNKGSGDSLTITWNHTIGS